MNNFGLKSEVPGREDDKYNEYCKKNGLVISKRFEIFMQRELKENGDKK